MPKSKLDPLPMTAFHILLALCPAELHGYGIIRQIEQQTGGKVRLGPATLYGSIQSLVEANFIQELDERIAEPGQTRRRYYRITSAGKKAASVASERLAVTLRLARAKHVFRGGHV